MERHWRSPELQTQDSWGGNGHMGMAFQNKEGNWFYFSQGAAEDKGTGSFLAGSDAEGGVELTQLSITEKVMVEEDGKMVEKEVSRNSTMNEVISGAESGAFGYEYTDHATLNTTSAEDDKISLGANKVKRDHESGDKEYNLYTNNCVDACQDAVQSKTNINLPMDWNPKPNAYFQKLKPYTQKANEERKKKK